MTNYPYFLFFFFLFAKNLSVFAQNIPFPEIEYYIENGMKQWQIPGLSLAIVKEGKIVYAKGFGVKEWGKEELVDENTIFAIGSNTKAFLATSAVMLQNEGKLDLDAPVKNYFPQLNLSDSIANQAVILRDFLCHRSGLGACEGDLIGWESVLSQQEILERMKFLPFQNALRTEFSYSNLGYVLASEIVAKAAKMPNWSSHVQKNLFSPLEMKRTCTSTKDLYNLGNVATPHVISAEKIQPIRWRNLDNIGGCGSINSSAMDMANWLIAQTNNGKFKQKQVIPQNVLQATHQPNVSISFTPYKNKYAPFSHFYSYGLGWFLTDYRGKFLISHPGEVDGMSCETAFLPEENLGVVVLSNSDTYDFCPALCKQILDAYLAAPFTDWKERASSAQQEKNNWKAKKEADLLAEKDSLSPPTLPFSAFVGKYTHKLYGEMNISLIAGKLELSSKTHPHIYGKLVHWRENDFMCYWNDVAWRKCFLSFTLTPDNKKIEGFIGNLRPSLDGIMYEFLKE